MMMKLEGVDGAGHQPELPRFETLRFIVMPLTPTKARELAAVLLQDERLAARLPWMQQKTSDGALREAFLLELECNCGNTSVWGIIERARRMYVGAVLARNTPGGVDLEVLCASQFWDQRVAEEAGPPVADWLEEQAANRLKSLH
jgi:RimJ/RimL family protein N-acetyltransferase